MTRERAIDIIKCLAWHTRPDEEDVEQAIETLKQELCEDCISKSQALKEMEESAKHHANDSREEALLRRDRDIIRALPPVKPQEPRKGHWIYQTSDDYLGELNRYYECSECGRTVGDTVGDIYTEYPYCHCGAKMVKGGEK